MATRTVRTNDWGPFAPIERPEIDHNLPLHFQVKGALQGDDDSDDEPVPAERVRPDVRLSQNSRIIPREHRQPAFCPCCLKMVVEDRWNVCPNCKIQDTVVQEGHVIERAAGECPLDFDGDLVVSSDLVWLIGRELIKAALTNRAEPVKIEPEEDTTSADELGLYLVHRISPLEISCRQTAP